MRQRERSRKAWRKWQKLVSEQRRSGQSVAGFCRERGLRAGHFFWWKRRLSERAARNFVEVKLATGSEEPSRWNETRVEIRLRNGRSLVVAPACDTERVRALVAAVEGA